MSLPSWSTGLIDGGGSVKVELSGRSVTVVPAEIDKVMNEHYWIKGIANRLVDYSCWWA